MTTRFVNIRLPIKLKLRNLEKGGRRSCKIGWTYLVSADSVYAQCGELAIVGEVFNEAGKIAKVRIVFWLS
jgi:hypothetical protein